MPERGSNSIVAEPLLLEAWRALLDTVQEGIVVVDAEGYIRHINRQAATELGLAPHRARGKHFRQVFCPSLPESQCWVSHALTAHRSVRNHHFVMEQRGKRQPLVADLTILNHGFGALITLSTANERQHWLQEREKQQAILGSLAEGLYTVDNEWRITSFNRAAETLTGWKEAEVLGRYCKSVLDSPQCVENCPLAETLRRRKPIVDYAMTLRDRRGNELPVKVNTAVLYNHAGEATGGVISFRSCALGSKPRGDGRLRTHFHGLVGQSKRMLEVYQMIEETADSKATVLILGETGTGKELVANAIQKLSARRNQPYVRVNCAAIPETLLESELFGHVKGAFTDAYTNRIGRFELADGGTIFLDEVGDLTPPAQLRLLRVLEQGEFQRLGSSESVKVDVRVIAATNRDLWKLVQEGRFRDDLYYRLNVIQIHLPPLRERRDDLPCLIDHFMEKYRLRTGKPITEISEQAYALLTAYAYPGNVRELENVIEHAFVRTTGNIITEDRLPLYVRRNAVPQPGDPNPPSDDERARLLHVLSQCHWNRQKAAERLGISRITLWRKMKALNLLDATN